MDDNIKFDDTYTGPRWTYGSIWRPFTNMFSYFDGFIIWSDKPSSQYPTFGTMQTWKPIPHESAEGWGMILITQPQEVTA
jgi:hypothetical protein